MLEIKFVDCVNIGYDNIDHMLNTSWMLSTIMPLLMAVQFLLELIHLMNVIEALKKKEADISILNERTIFYM